MSDKTFDRVLARANPIDDDAVAGLPLSDAESDLLEAIVSTPGPILDAPPRRRLIVVLAAAAVALVLTAGLILLPRLTNSAAPASTPATPATPAPTTPSPTGDRVIFDRPDKMLDHVYQNGLQTEESYRYMKMQRSLSVTGLPAAGYQTEYDRLSSGRGPGEQVDVMGLPGTLFRTPSKRPEMDPRDESIILLRPNDRIYLTIRAGFASADEYHQVIGSLRLVDQATWEAALPSQIVTPGEEAAALNRMMTGVTKPAGFDIRRVRTGQASDRYSLASRLFEALSCRAIRQWKTAEESGDSAGAARAIAIIRSGRGWKFDGADPDGDFAMGAEFYADEMSHGRTPASYDQMNCR